MPRLIATEKFFYNNRNVEAGEEFEANEQDVPILTYAHTPKARLPEAKAPDGSHGRRRGYNRRDMQAKDAPAPAPAPASPPASAERTSLHPIPTAAPTDEGGKGQE